MLMLCALAPMIVPINPRTDAAMKNLTIISFASIVISAWLTIFGQRYLKDDRRG